MKKINSEKDTDGRLWIACTECERGYYGSCKNKCSAGGRHKIFRGNGCFAGELITAIKEKLNRGAK